MTLLSFSISSCSSTESVGYPRLLSVCQSFEHCPVVVYLTFSLPTPRRLKVKSRKTQPKVTQLQSRIDPPRCLHRRFSPIHIADQNILSNSSFTISEPSLPLVSSDRPSYVHRNGGKEWVSFPHSLSAVERLCRCKAQSTDVDSV